MIDINELTLEKLSQSAWFVKYSLLTSLVLLLVALSYLFILKPHFFQYSELCNEEIKLRAEFETKQQIANVNAYRKQLKMMNGKYGNMLKQLAAESEMSNLLDDISKTGVKSGLTFELFAPQLEETHDFYIELAIHIIVLGEYQQLALFLSRISEFNRLVTLHDFEIAKASIDNQKTSSEIKLNDLLQMKITAKIYRYHEQ